MHEHAYIIHVLINMQANKYFQVKELVSSKIYNQYGDDAIKFLDPKALEALENVREILNVPLICNNWYAGGSRNYSGYREPGCGVGVKNSYHCIDINTEILTNHGWKTYNTIDIQNDKVYSYNIDKNGIEIVPIQQYFFQKYDGEIIQIQNKLIDIFVTDQHRLLTKAKNNYKDREFYRFELAKDSFGKRREIMNAANNLSVSEDFDLNIWRLAMAVIADGSISKKNIRKYNNFVFKLVKERDINELENILYNLNLSYSKTKVISYYLSNGDPYYCWQYILPVTKVTKSVLDIIGKNKKIPNTVLELPSYILKELLITYAKFDGTIDKRTNCNCMTIYSTDEHNIDMLQKMSILAGMRCIKRSFTNQKVICNNIETTIREIHHLYIHLNRSETRINEKDWSKKQFSGYVWCVSNRNETIITRRNGKIAIIGNCKGQAFDLISTKLTAKEMREILENNQDKLRYPIRVEKWDNKGEISWLHIDIGNTKGKKLYFFKA